MRASAVSHIELDSFPLNFNASHLLESDPSIHIKDSLHLEEVIPSMTYIPRVFRGGGRYVINETPITSYMAGVLFVPRFRELKAGEEFDLGFLNFVDVMSPLEEDLKDAFVYEQTAQHFLKSATQYLSWLGLALPKSAGIISLSVSRSFGLSRVLPAEAREYIYPEFGISSETLVKNNSPKKLKLS
jgi:hypothetical protein